MEVVSERTAGLHELLPTGRVVEMRVLLREDDIVVAEIDRMAGFFSEEGTPASRWSATAM
jgi:hypothetical protein